MVQRKIDYYFRRPPRPRQEVLAQCASSASFLHLPYNIRHRIYVLAGLVRFCPINMNQEGPRAEALRTGAKQITGFSCFYIGRRFLGLDFGIDDVPGCECPALPVSLLCVSPAISDEVSHILYSENAFTISRSDLWGLAPLRNMNKWAVGSLRRLTIRLNNGQCVFDFKLRAPLDMPPCHPLCKSHGLHDTPLSNQTRQGNAVIREWQDLCSTWGVHLQPSQLRLDFVCDTKDRSTAQQVVGTLTTLPRLQACSVRLGLQPDWELRMISRTTALRLLETPPRGEDDAHKARSYSYYLPTEIITRILEYSDLIAPYDLEWRPDGGFAPYDCCKLCTATLDCCSCSKYHAAHSTTCTCWTPPKALFLVSRQVHDVAMAIFYGRNRFVLLSRGERIDKYGFGYSSSPRSPLQAPLAQFLARISRRAGSLIRFLGLVISTTAPGYSRPGSDGNGQRAWMLARNLVPKRLDMHQLQLSVYVESVFYMHPEDPSPGWNVYDAAYRRVLGDLSMLRGLRDLFLYLQWPHPYRITQMDSVAVTLEKEVMGASYSSTDRGKWSGPLRLWYPGRSREGTVHHPDGTRVWPFHDNEIPLSPPPMPYEYV